MRTKEFDASVKKETDRIMRDMKKDAELAAMKAAAENANIVAQKDTYIAELKAKLEHESENLTYKIEKAVAEKEKEICWVLFDYRNRSALDQNAGIYLM